MAFPGNSNSAVGCARIYHAAVRNGTYPRAARNRYATLSDAEITFSFFFLLKSHMSSLNKPLLKRGKRFFLREAQQGAIPLLSGVIFII